MADDNKVRIDKYLWAIRIYKTRSMAADACKGGKVKMNGQAVKPSYFSKIGDEYHIHKGIERKVIRVLALQANRTDAKTAVLNYQDITPVEETTSFKSMFNAPILKRERGAGRPTKKDRREIGELLDKKHN